MDPRPKIDTVDEQILRILSTRARAFVSDISREIRLSSAAVTRRIARLERQGVIKGYSAIVDLPDTDTMESLVIVGAHLPLDTGELTTALMRIPEVQQVSITRGGPEVFVWITSPSTAHLQTAVRQIQRLQSVAAIIKEIPLESSVKR